jgi:hypothetical protein
MQKRRRAECIPCTTREPGVLLREGCLGEESALEAVPDWAGDALAAASSSTGLESRMEENRLIRGPCSATVGGDTRSSSGAATDAEGIAGLISSLTLIAVRVAASVFGTCLGSGSTRLDMWPGTAVGLGRGYGSTQSPMRTDCVFGEADDH